MCFAVSSQRRSFPQVPVSERCRLSVVYRVCESLASVQDVLLVFLRPKSVIEVHVQKRRMNQTQRTDNKSVKPNHGEPTTNMETHVRQHKSTSQVYSLQTHHTHHTRNFLAPYMHTNTFCVLQMLRMCLKRMEAQDGDAWIWSCASLLVRQQVVFAGISADRGVHLPHQ